MNRTLKFHARREAGWALVVVLAASVVCISLAMALVANRYQAMKLASRQEKDQLAALDNQIAADYVNRQVKQMIQQQVGGVNTTASALTFTNPNGSTTANLSGSTTTANGQSLSLYQTAGQFGSTDGQSQTLDLYTPQTVANGLFQTTLSADPFDPTNGNTDPADPLLGVKAAQLLNLTIPVQLDSTAVDDTVFYVGNSGSVDYTLREVPLSIYSLYGTGNSSISPDLLATGDAGRIYVNGSLTVSGQVTASRPLTAQEGVNAPSDGSASLTVGTTAQVLGQTGSTLDQQLMANGNQILTSGTQGAGVQVLPTSNFGDPNNAALIQLGNQCEFQISYADTLGNGSGQAQVVDNRAAIPDTPGSFSDQVTQDSNTMNARWDLPNSSATPPPGYLAAIDPSTDSRLMNKETDPLKQGPMQFIVLDYSHIATLNPPKQTFNIQGNPNDYALLIRNGVDGNGTGQVTNGFSVVTNLDIYVSGGIAPSPTANSPAISLITSGMVHATP